MLLWFGPLKTETLHALLSSLVDSPRGPIEVYIREAHSGWKDCQMDLVANQVRHHLCHSKIHQRPIAKAEGFVSDENILMIELVYWKTYFDKAAN